MARKSPNEFVSEINPRCVPGWASCNIASGHFTDGYICAVRQACHRYFDAIWSVDWRRGSLRDENGLSFLNHKDAELPHVSQAGLPVGLIIGFFIMVKSRDALICRENAERMNDIRKERRRTAFYVP